MTVIQPVSAQGPRGYTLVELVLVIVIAGILAAVAVPHFFDNQVFSQRGYADELAGALRAAQKAAVASDCPTEVAVTAGSYIVQQQAAAGNTCNPNDNTWSTPVIALDGAAVQGTAPAGVTASPTGSFVFTGSGALSASPATSLAVGPQTISIDATTGFVQVQ
jgi:MSHA pilin protein MshC